MSAPAAATTQPATGATTSTTASIPSSTAESKKTWAIEPAPPVITLAGKVALVTGASRGIGAATALRLAHDGAAVVVNYSSSPERAQQVVDVILAHGGRASAVKADVGTISGVDHLFAETKKLYGRIDIVIANAGVLLPTAGPLADLKESAWDELYDINVKGVAFILKNAATMVERGGRVITLGSVVHRGKFPGNAAYAASKAAVETLSSAAAIELAPKLITVNCIQAGPTDTEMVASMPAEVVEQFRTAPLMKRLGTAADVADAIALLASERARWITGQAIGVSGGTQD